MKMIAMEGEYSVYRFAPGASVPGTLFSSDGFVSVTRTGEELSVVCRSGSLQGESRCEGGWRLYQVLGPLDFGLIGVLSSITAPLAAAGISVFAVSTYDTDYILWKFQKDIQAQKTLRDAGFEVG